jgi:hypothetical protein
MPFTKLVPEVASALNRFEFSQIDEIGSERHGALEWTWIANSSEFALFVALAAIPMNHDDGPLRPYQLEVWYGADDGQRFGRFLSGALPSVFDTDVAQFPIIDAIVQTMVTSAAHAARQLTPESLVGRHIGRTLAQ